MIIFSILWDSFTLILVANTFEVQHPALLQIQVMSSSPRGPRRALTVSVGELERGGAGALHSVRLQGDVILQQSVLLQQVFNFQQVLPEVRSQELSLKRKRRTRQSDRLNL